MRFLSTCARTLAVALHLLTSLHGIKPTCWRLLVYVRFSNRPFEVKRFQTIHPRQCRCRPRARASLRNRHQGPSIIGFEDEVERSFGRPYRQIDDRSKRTCELTSSTSREGHHCTAW